MAKRVIVEKVLDRYPPETLKRVSQAIRQSMKHHPHDATCDCPAIEALAILVMIQDEEEGPTDDRVGWNE